MEIQNSATVKNSMAIPQKVNRDLSHNIAILLLGISSQKTRKKPVFIQKLMFIAALSITNKKEETTTIQKLMNG